MVSLKTLFLGVWAALWVFIAIALVLSLLGGSVERCSTASADGRTLQETCQTEWSGLGLISVLLVLGLGAAFFAIRSLLASINEDRRRLSGLPR